MARGRNMFVEVSIMVKSFFYLIHHCCCSHPTRWNNSKTKSIWVGLVMILLGKVRMPLAHNTMSTHWWEDWTWSKDMDLLSQNMEPYNFLQWRWKYLDLHCEVDPSWEMGRETCRHTKGSVSNPKTRNPLIFQKLVWESKKEKQSN